MLKRILRDVLPTIISYTLSGMYSVVDGLFIGKAAGDTGLAAINIAWPVTAVITALGIGIGAGGSVLLSNSRGRGEYENSRRIRNNTMCLLVAASVLITIVFLIFGKSILIALGARGDVYNQADRYIDIIIKGSILQVIGTGMMPILRNTNQSFGAMVSMVLGFAVNIAVNYYLMFPVGMGIRGAAFGTVIAQGTVILLGVFFLKKSGESDFKAELDLHITKKILKLGITAFGVSIAPSAALVLTNLQCLKFGGDPAVACYAVISYIVFPVQNILAGIGDGTQPLMSFYYGADRKQELSGVRKTGYILAALTGIITMAGAILLSGHIGEWFGLSAQAEEYFQSGMCISAAAFMWIGIAKFNVSYLNAMLKVGRAAMLIYVESLVVTPVLLFVLPEFCGISGVWSSLPATAICMTAIYGMMNMKEGKKRCKRR